MRIFLAQPYSSPGGFSPLQNCRGLICDSPAIGYCSLLILLFFLIQGCKKNTDTQPAVSHPWNLIFEDEFNTDLSAWNSWYGGAFNEEIQLYRAEQLLLGNGVLKIEAHREEISGPTTFFDPAIKGFEYVSGRIESKVLFGPSDIDGEREYRFVARIRLPSGHGMWPAFWTYGDPWPTQGEIDILEAWGGEPFKYLTNIFYGTSSGVNTNEGSDVVHSIGQDLTSDFHIYEMIWKSNSIEIFFDGELRHTYTGNNVPNLFGKKQKVVLNTAVGGLFFKDRNSGNYADEAIMEVDWVQVYKR